MTSSLGRASPPQDSGVCLQALLPVHSTHGPQTSGLLSSALVTLARAEKEHLSNNNKPGTYVHSHGPWPQWLLSFCI